MSTQAEEAAHLAQLHDWWQQYGNAVLTLIAFIIILAGAWQFQQKRQRQQVEQASNLYGRYLLHPTPALENQMYRDYPHSAYATLVAWQEAKRTNKLQPLQWALAHQSQPTLNQLTRLRLGAMACAMGHTRQGLEALATLDDQHFAASVALRRGDCAMQAHQAAKATKHYRQALAHTQTMPQAIQTWMQGRLKASQLQPS